MAFGLGTNPIFQGLEKEHFALLHPLFVRVICASGTFIFQQGESADFIYLIESGKAEVRYKPYDGGTITLARIGADGLFGWSALLGSPNYKTSVIAAEDVVALRVRGADLRRVCLENPETGSVILDRLANAVSTHWKSTHEQIISILERGLNG